MTTTINPLAKLVDKPAHFRRTVKEREEKTIHIFLELLEKYFQGGGVTADADELLILISRLCGASGEKIPCPHQK
jgi:hypothetical protein